MQELKISSFASYINIFLTETLFKFKSKVHGVVEKKTRTAGDSLHPSSICIKVERTSHPVQENPRTSYSARTQGPVTLWVGRCYKSVFWVTRRRGFFYLQYCSSPRGGSNQGCEGATWSAWSAGLASVGEVVEKACAYRVLECAPPTLAMRHPSSATCPQLKVPVWCGLVLSHKGVDFCSKT